MGFICDTSKKSREPKQPRSAMNRTQEKSYKKVTQQTVVSACIERITSVMAADLVKGQLNIPDVHLRRNGEPDMDKLEKFLHSQITKASSHLPSAVYHLFKCDCFLILLKGVNGIDSSSCRISKENSHRRFCL
jgi:hypothetical protein